MNYAKKFKDKVVHMIHEPMPAAEITVRTATRCSPLRQITLQKWPLVFIVTQSQWARMSQWYLKSQYQKNLGVSRECYLSRLGKRGAVLSCTSYICRGRKLRLNNLQKESLFNSTLSNAG